VFLSSFYGLLGENAAVVAVWKERVEAGPGRRGASDHKNVHKVPRPVVRRFTARAPIK
jgi:hypothetical protein